MNELTRAWNLLKPEERPGGMRVDEVLPSLFIDSGPHGDEPSHMSQPAARDRLIVAVEGVLLGMGWDHEMHHKEHLWWMGCEFHRNPDRLAAACDALEAVRKDVQS